MCFYICILYIEYIYKYSERVCVCVCVRERAFIHILGEYEHIEETQHEGEYIDIYTWEHNVEEP